MDVSYVVYRVKEGMKGQSYLQMTGQSQLISFDEHSSPDLIQGHGAVPPIPVHLWYRLAWVQVNYGTFQR